MTRAAVSSLLYSTELYVATQINLSDEDIKLPIENGKSKQALMMLKTTAGIFVANNPPSLLTWGNVRDVLKGIGLYCRDTECSFEFDVGKDLGVGWGILDARK